MELMELRKNMLMEHGAHGAHRAHGVEKEYALLYQLSTLVSAFSSSFAIGVLPQRQSVCRCSTS